MPAIPSTLYVANSTVPYADQSNQDGLRPAAFSISGVTGSITDGSTMTISGGGFEAAPSNTFYENFSGFTSLGEDLRTTNSNFDTESPPHYGTSVADSRSGTYSANMYAESSTTPLDWKAASNGVEFAGGTTETFVSYSVKNPTGKYFPARPPELNAFSTQSISKFAWLLDGGVSNENDLVIPTLVSQQFSMQGNDLGNIYMAMGSTLPSYWRFGEWVRMTTWLKAGAIPQTDAGDVYFQAMNAVDGMTEFDTPDNNVIFLNGTGPDYQWDKVNFAGWYRTDGDQTNAENIEVLYDDIYVAWGANAAARVELGDSATYASCTNLSVCDHITWASGTITATVRQSDLNFGASVYLHLTLGDNTSRVTYQVI